MLWESRKLDRRYDAVHMVIKDGCSVSEFARKAKVAQSDHSQDRLLQYSIVASSLLNVTFDCINVERTSEFWAAVLGWPITFVDSPGNPYFLVAERDDSYPRFVFVAASESKLAKNRVHPDIATIGNDDVAYDAELARIIGLGATVLDDRRQKVPGGWVVLQDPEGNEFCLE